MQKSASHSLTAGPILPSLLSFAVPVLLALFLQAMYGAADLIIVGQFAGTSEQSGVATGSQLLNLITMVITGLTMGITVLVGNAIGGDRPRLAGRGIGTGIALFAVLAVLLTGFLVPFADSLALLLHAPAEAVAPTSHYIRICGIGAVFITAYNVIGAVFRGLGDAKTPLITVAIACAVNIGGGSDPGGRLRPGGCRGGHRNGRCPGHQRPVLPAAHPPKKPALLPPGHPL